MKPSKLSDWLSVGPLLGILLDLNRMTISLTPEKVEEMHGLLAAFFNREKATPREVLKLIGKLRYFACHVHTTGAVLSEEDGRRV